MSRLSNAEVVKILRGIADGIESAQDGCTCIGMRSFFVVAHQLIDEDVPEAIADELTNYHRAWCSLYKGFV